MADFVKLSIFGTVCFFYCSFSFPTTVMICSSNQPTYEHAAFVFSVGHWIISC